MRLEPTISPIEKVKFVEIVPKEKVQAILKAE